MDDLTDNPALRRYELAVDGAVAFVQYERRPDALRYRGPGTDLIVGLLPNARWGSARFRTAGGIDYVANMPTEEIFTTLCMVTIHPDRRRATMYRAGHPRPLLFGGSGVDALPEDWCGPALGLFTSASIPTPENRWVGPNRGAWSDAEYDRLVSAVQSTLDPDERARVIVQAIARLTDQVGKVSLYFNPTVITLPASVQGMDVRAPDADVTWNLYQWTLP